jgi:hypothetical protein
VEALFFFCHVLGILILLPLLILLPRREAGFPLVEFYNHNGWASNSEATLVGAIEAVTPLIGFDCAVHMGMSVSRPCSFCLHICRIAEVVENTHSIPFTLLVAYSVNVVLGFLALMTW